jgi:tRNA U34 5-carboxymethylaminomethyl modifying GTPase MnmE/TrmE
MKGRNRLQYIEDIRDKDYKRIKTYINHLESSINYNETSLDKKELKQKREEVEAFHKALEKLIRSL